MALLEFTENGIYCPAGDFYIDPWRRVPRAVITHAHSDHARWGMGAYLAHRDSVPIMRLRLGDDIKVRGVEYGQAVKMNGVEVTLFPAGHIIGSAQVRVTHRGETWVVSGDYKVEDDGISAPFEPVKCHTFITESTFGLPVYRWPAQELVINQINEWWSQNAENGRASLLIAYSLGKAQRVLANVDPTIGPVFTHGAVENTNQALRKQGIELPETTKVSNAQTKDDYKKALIVAPPGANGSNWTRRLGPHSLAMASGWMALRGTRRRRAADRGFVLSDHADWEGLNQAIKATGAEQVFVTHGYTDIFSRWLQEQGLKAGVVQTQFEGEVENDPGDREEEES